MFQVTEKTAICNADIVLSDEQQYGLAYEIAGYLRNYVCHHWDESTYVLKDVRQEDMRQAIDFSKLTTKDGKLTKRISKWVKSLGHELSQAHLSAIGGIITHHSPGEFTYDITDQFYWRSGDFGDHGSCFWSDRENARYMMMDNGGLALRFYDDEGKGNGRCWVMPKGEKWVIFNAYGCSLELVQTRLSFIFPAYHTKFVSLSNYGETGGTLYINRDLALLVSEKESTARKIDLEIGEDESRRHQCDSCGDRVDEDDIYYMERYGYSICESCREYNWSYCDDCQRDTHIDDMRSFEARIKRGSAWVEREVYCCDSCQDEEYRECDGCEMWVPINQEMTETVDGDSVCGYCLGEEFEKCDECNEYYRKGEGCCQEQEGEGLTYRQLIAKLQAAGLYRESYKRNYRQELTKYNRDGGKLVISYMSLYRVETEYETASWMTEVV
jgi:hypothetical protein